MSHRRIARVVTLPTASPGFLGPGHTAVEVLDPQTLKQNDPFVLLMDDRLDLSPEVRKLGDAHPHAGIETVTLFLEGVVHDADEGDTVPGDALWMSAGRGVIHSENIQAGGRMRILQLWVRLPKSERSSPPRVQLIKKSGLPIRREPGVEARVYSGESGGVKSPTKNFAPVTLVDFHLEAGASIEQQLPASYNGFLYVLEGNALLGADRTPVAKGQVAWLDRSETEGETQLRLEGPARVVLYAGKPQNEPLLHYGPFVAGSQSELVQLFEEFRAGGFERLSNLMANDRTGASP
jgi:redox-sensitive bicupin YhaK (pirin superfamily)